MTWFGVLFVCMVAVSSMVSVAMVGQRREPTTPGTAVVVLIINGLLIWGAVTVGTVHP